MQLRRAKQIEKRYLEKLFEIYFGGYTADISGDFVSSFKEHSELCDEKDGTKGRK